MSIWRQSSTEQAQGKALFLEGFRHVSQVLRKHLPKDPLVFIGSILLVGILVIAFLGPLVVTADPFRISSSTFAPPSLNHPFGTDQFGRDILSRVVNAFRLDLFIALVSVTVALVLGTIIGMVSGYAGGRFDDALMRVIDVIMSFPMFILAMALVAFLGVGIKNVILVTIVINVPVFARLGRGDVLARKTLEYVDAARCSGCTGTRILARHILPNTIGPLIVQGSLNLAWAVLNVAGLSFLGIGIKPPTAELGVMIAEGGGYLYYGAWWMSVFPGLALMCAIFAFNLLGDGLQDRLDPRRVVVR